MTKTTAHIAAFALSALVTLGIVAGMNGIATHEYAAAANLRTEVAVQQVTVIGHRVDA